jgi:hypothetical protein
LSAKALPARKSQFWSRGLHLLITGLMHRMERVKPSVTTAHDKSFARRWN